MKKNPIPVTNANVNISTSNNTFEFVNDAKIREPILLSSLNR